MAKKRSCRRTTQERLNHDRAVALRKMTDDQLCEHVDRQFTAGFDAARVGIELHNDKIIEAITGVKGIGATTLEKIRAAIEQATGGGGGDKPTTNNL